MFKTFPEFSKLTLADREEYEALIKGFPPLSDVCFPSIMAWWGYLGGLAVARLNGNLVISYWLPGDEERSGLSLLGTESIDESTCTIFDYLRGRGDPVRLVNVPEFVVNSMRYPELFNFQTGTGDDEYILTLSKYAVLDNMPPYMRIRVRKFIRRMGKDNLELKELDLGSDRDCQTLLDAVMEWPVRGLNNINKLEREVLPVAVNQGSALGTHAVGLYINNSLQAYCLYFSSGDRDYAIISHVRLNYDIPCIFEYVAHAFSEYASEKGYKYLNIHADGGSQKMRVLKIALKPQGFFRKYTIEPA